MVVWSCDGSLELCWQLFGVVMAVVWSSDGSCSEFSWQMLTGMTVVGGYDSI